MKGLVINGKVFPVDGVRVIGPSDPGGVALSPGDGCPRRAWPHQWFLHKTIADDPEKLLAGTGPSAHAGGAADTAAYWAGDPQHSGAHLVVGHDGTVLQTADLATVAAYHAEQSNMSSVGLETKELAGGGFYAACARAVVAVTVAGCRALGIQLVAQWPYRGRPLTRMKDGGRDCYGIFGHRDNTERRGRWDPGDLLFSMLRDAGVALVDFEAGADRTYIAAIQRVLAADGFYSGAIDGLAGLGTRDALLAAGYRDGIYALGRA